MRPFASSWFILFFDIPISVATKESVRRATQRK
jgi:hypothetical protein